MQQLIRFRKEHACLHQKEELRGIDRTSCGMPDVSYHGENAWQAKAEVASRQLGVMYAAVKGEDELCFWHIICIGKYVNLHFHLPEREESGCLRLIRNREC